ncbi:metallophosphoesterase family protein [Dyadobacter tibetensis]|uniref:metallophosphoesterase family protein n=1 Tax=Dyadobacter tibetensis TaxID=1211851 RepID=UPI000471DD42|nr:metallophosphoesterase family protein [Dyadobacter tibetensis]
MTRIGLLSDTHGYLDPRILEHFAQCDEVWHAGDIGSLEIIDQLEAFKPCRIVYGNIDHKEIMIRTQENLRFEIEGFNVWITHIGGAPPRYNPSVLPFLKSELPDLFVCGHSHILRVIRDKSLDDMLYINPGAAGKEGFHKIRTLLRFNLHEGVISSMEVVELGKRGSLES